MVDFSQLRRVFLLSLKQELGDLGIPKPIELILQILGRSLRRSHSFLIILQILLIPIINHEILLLCRWIRLIRNALINYSHRVPHRVTGNPRTLKILTLLLRQFLPVLGEKLVQVLDCSALEGEDQNVVALVEFVDGRVVVHGLLVGG